MATYSVVGWSPSNVDAVDTDRERTRMRTRRREATEQATGRQRRPAMLMALIAAVLAALAIPSAAAALGPLPQILPIPQVGPLGPHGGGPGGGPGGPGNPSLPTRNCTRAHHVHFHPVRVRSRGLHIGHVANTFGINIFGIAAGGLIQNESCSALGRELNADARAGARWLRIDINWAQIQNAGPTHYFWQPIDRVVSAAAQRGLHVLGAIIYTPWWARPPGTAATYAPAPSTYAAFARAAARHYASLGVHAFEIWNEPNSVAFWQPAASPIAYAGVLRAADAAIKSVAPSATVLTGGLAPDPTADGNYAPVDFLQGIYSAGAKGYFDAVGDHPYCWPLFPGDEVGSNPWYQMYGTRPSLRSVMVANGDSSKKIWATEFGAPTGGPTGTFISPGSQARMVLKAYKLFATYKWGGPLFFYQGRDLGTDRATDQDFFGFLKHNFSPKPSYRAYRTARTSVARRARRR